MWLVPDGSVCYRSHVAHVIVRVRVSGKRAATASMTVDTGASYTVLPPALVRRIGAPMHSRRFSVTLADGRTKRVRVCTVGIRVGDREAATTAVVLPGAEPLLGVETLEMLGLKVNPSRGKLEPTRRHAALLVGVRAKPRVR